MRDFFALFEEKDTRRREQGKGKERPAGADPAAASAGRFFDAHRYRAGKQGIIISLIQEQAADLTRLFGVIAAVVLRQGSPSDTDRRTVSDLFVVVFVPRRRGGAEAEAFMEFARSMTFCGREEPSSSVRSLSPRRRLTEISGFFERA